MARIDDLAPAVIINCQTKVTSIVELTLEEKIKRIEEITRAEEKEANEQEKAAIKAAALDKLKLDKRNSDLLLALGLISEPL